MRLFLKRFFPYLALALCGGTLFQHANAGCARLAATELLFAANGCFMFDCQNGVFGGLLDPCAPGQEIFVDCPTTGGGG